MTSPYNSSDLSSKAFGTTRSGSSTLVSPLAAAAALRARRAAENSRWSFSAPTSGALVMASLYSGSFESCTRPFRPGSRRQRQMVNDLYLRVSAAHHSRRLDRDDLGVDGHDREEPLGFPDALQSFWEEVRGRRGSAHAPALERVVAGCGDAWSTWEPFCNCTEEEEEEWIASLTLSSVEDKSVPGVAIPNGAGFRSRTKAQRLYPSKIGVHIEHEHFATKERKRNALDDVEEQWGVFSLEEESETLANSESRTIYFTSPLHHFYRMDYRLRTICCHRAHCILPILYELERELYEQGFLRATSAALLSGGALEEAGDDGTLSDVTGYELDSIMIRKPTRGPRGANFFLVSGFYRLLLHGIAKYHGLKSRSMDVTNFHDDIELGGAQEPVQTAVNRPHRMTTVSLPNDECRLASPEIPLTCLVRAIDQKNGDLRAASESAVLCLARTCSFLVEEDEHISHHLVP